jgi:hypothetical protein
MIRKKLMSHVFHLQINLGMNIVIICLLVLLKNKWSAKGVDQGVICIVHRETKVVNFFYENNIFLKLKRFLNLP